MTELLFVQTPLPIRRRESLERVLVVATRMHSAQNVARGASPGHDLRPLRGVLWGWGCDRHSVEPLTAQGCLTRGQPRRPG